MQRMWHWNIILYNWGNASSSIILWSIGFRVSLDENWQLAYVVPHCTTYEGVTTGHVTSPVPRTKVLHQVMWPPLCYTRSCDLLCTTYEGVTPGHVTSSVLHQVMWPPLCYTRSCDRPCVTPGHVTSPVLRQVMWPPLCYTRSCDLPCVTPGHVTSPVQVRNAFMVMDLVVEQIMEIMSVLAAILHLGNISFVSAAGVCI